MSAWLMTKRLYSPPSGEFFHTKIQLRSAHILYFDIGKRTEADTRRSGAGDRVQLPTYTSA